MKQWAKKHMVGVENTLFPSFTPDMKNLDEDGIRHDVQMSIKHGFFSTMCATETGLTLEEAKQFVAIAADEAKDTIVVTTSLILDTFEDNMELMLHAEKVGVEGILLGYPPNFQPSSAEEVYQKTKEFCDATCMHVTLYPSPHFKLDKFHNSGFPLDILPELADIENVVAIKIGELGLFADAHRLVGDKLLIGCPVERYVPLLIKGFDMQWMGAGCYEVFQSPEKPYLTQYFKLLRQGKWDEGMAIYWKLAPARNMFEQQFNQTVMTGTYNWHMQKYYQWCVGGNGGLTRQPAMKVHSWEAQQTRLAFFTIDIEAREPEEEFVIGRKNYEKMYARKTAESIGDDDTNSEDIIDKLNKAIKDTEVELNKIPMMIRPLAKRGFEKNSGQSIAEWLKTVAVLKDHKYTTDSLEHLKKLANYYSDAPAQAKKFTKDPAVLKELENKMKERFGIVIEVIAQIEQK